MKKACLSLILCATSLCLAQAQQITRFAIVDMARVNAAFQGDGKAGQSLETQAAKIQEEVDKRTAEINELKKSYTEAVNAKNTADAKRLEGELQRKIATLKNYYDVETKKLEDAKSKVGSSQTPEFAARVYNAVRLAAESEGYVMVLNLQNSKGMIAWYSQAIDITDKVIANLKRSSR
ncbi:MAG: OmpH family outer membrane protein [Spirochaetaceae bacterium]|jgi:outer membrane protein|nr:OmpH family outer membrane protein [Spirochaetaceae bacterium]GMO30328.1 MAG: OmpH family outer membrane protein [Termitinemataceae bacterium]